MQKIEEIRQKYLKDTNLMSSKSRFGYFSIMPSATAGANMFQKKNIVKDQNGKIKTQQRNIFSGLTASGMLKKSYFNYQPSVFQGDPYVDPGKYQIKQKMKKMQKLVGKDVYKPLSLTKTPEPKSSYEHMSDKPIQKTVKDVIDEQGKVKTQQRNIYSNTITHIQKQRLQQIKYIQDPYDNAVKYQREQAKKNISLRGQVPFKSSSPMKMQFFTARQTFGVDLKCKNKTQRKIAAIKIVEHEANFKPSCQQKIDTFSYPEYMPSGSKAKDKNVNANNNNKQKFKIYCPRENTKPCPSISTMRFNIIRSIR